MQEWERVIQFVNNNLGQHFNFVYYLKQLYSQLESFLSWHCFYWEFPLEMICTGLTGRCEGLEGGQTEPLLSPHFNGLMEQMSPHDPLSCIMQQFHSDCSSGRLISIIFSLWAGQMAYLGSSQPDPGMFRASSGGPGGERREIFEILC